MNLFLFGEIFTNEITKRKTSRNFWHERLKLTIITIGNLSRIELHRIFTIAHKAQGYITEWKLKINNNISIIL